MKNIAGMAVSALLCATTSALAWDALPAKNEATLARSFALPALGQSRVLAPSEQRFRFGADEITEFYRDSNASESILLDGETTKLDFAYRRGFADDLEFTAELPVYIVGGGFMDGFIQDWHRWFGLPNGGRETVANDQRRYTYTRGGTTLLNEGGSATTLGDLELGLGWQSNEHLAIRALLKLPTGDDRHLTGGNLGGAVWADWALPFAAQSDWDGFVSGGLSVARRSDVLSALQKTYAAFGGAGLSYDITRNLQAFTQLYAHSALYDNTDLDGLRKPGLQLAVGGRYQVSPSTAFELYVQEDPIVSSSPDFSIHIGLTVR